MCSTVPLVTSHCSVHIEMELHSGTAFHIACSTQLHAIQSELVLIGRSEAAAETYDPVTSCCCCLDIFRIFQRVFSYDIRGSVYYFESVVKQ